MKSGVSVTIDRVADALRAIDLLGTKRVMVGIPSTKAGRSAAGDPINNAALGYIHENGAPEVGIPARPFLVPGVASVQPKIEEGLKAAGDAAFGGKEESVDRALTRVGLIGQAAVRKKITDGPFVPLKPATISARKRRSDAAASSR